MIMIMIMSVSHATLPLLWC